MTLKKALKNLDGFESWTDGERIRRFVETMDQLNNGDALAFLDHWISHVRASLVVTSMTPLNKSLVVTPVTASGDTGDR